VILTKLYNVYPVALLPSHTHTHTHTLQVLQQTLTNRESILIHFSGSSVGFAGLDYAGEHVGLRK
jgi:hypothetical protein